MSRVLWALILAPGMCFAQGWSGFGRDAQHTAVSPVPAQNLARVRWQTPVDLDPQYSGDDLLIHYGSPLVTPANTVLVPVKTGSAGGFRMEAHHGADGSLVWMFPSDYILPPHGWIPAFGAALAGPSRVYFPGAGGTVYFRDQPDEPEGAVGQIAFFGLDDYRSNPLLFDQNVVINTPLTADGRGSIYFGFLVLGSVPGSLTSGIARIDAGGNGTWIAAADAAFDTEMTGVPTNSAPALSTDGSTLYVAIGNGTAAYLVALDSATLEPRGRVRLMDPATGLDAVVSDNGTASPVAGPDGDVYFGVLESNFENHGRGWLLHFDATLAQAGTVGAFGWDTTPGIVPREMVPSYTGDSHYLLMTKYNDYVASGGSGWNRIAILDPNAAETDPLTGAAVMQVILSAAGPTPDGPPPAVKEWCINSAAIDPAGKSVFAGNEDGILYRWDVSANALTQAMLLTAGVGEAYTPTVIGPDGTVYAINNATLFAVGE